MRPFLTLYDPIQASAYYQRGLWQSDTFYHLLVQHAAARPHAVALRDGHITLEWSELHRWVDRVAAAWRQQGLTRGDCVSLWMSNRVQAIVAFLACSRQGFACNPSLHRTHTCTEVVALLSWLKSAVFITEPGWGADRDRTDLNARLDGLPFLRHVYTPETLFELKTTSMSPPSDNPDQVVYLAFTSGTTGAPKCVMHSDNTLLANTRDMVRDWHVGPQTRLLTLSPVSHHITWVAVGQWLLSGGLLITDDPPQGMSKLDWIMETGATYVMGVPTHAIDLLTEQKACGLPRLGDIEVFYLSGSPIPPSVAEAFVAQGITPQNVYGMTENSSHQYTHRDDDLDVILNTCGRGGPAYDVQIVDANNPDQLLRTGEVGQIAGRGASLMLGYYGNQDATESSFNRDGWFLSGDLGSLDAQGNLKIAGRLKDLIIRGGHNIHPAHIEAYALRHPEVEKVAVFPVPDERLGEKVCIAVIGSVMPQPLLSHLDAEGLSRYDMPEYFIRMDAFPLTASGKILKRELIEMAKRGEIAPTPIRFQPD
jgi:acyl-CoA synthetase